MDSTAGETEAEVQEQIERAAELLHRARFAIALTGAGLSKESGVPTFRGEGGLWTRDGEPPMNGYQLFLRDPAEHWRHRHERAGRGDRTRQAEPRPPRLRRAGAARLPARGRDTEHRQPAPPRRLG